MVQVTDLPMPMHAGPEASCHHDDDPALGEDQPKEKSLSYMQGYSGSSRKGATEDGRLDCQNGGDPRSPFQLNAGASTVNTDKERLPALLSAPAPTCGSISFRCESLLAMQKNSETNPISQGLCMSNLVCLDCSVLYTPKLRGLKIKPCLKPCRVTQQALSILGPAVAISLGLNRFFIAIGWDMCIKAGT